MFEKVKHEFLNHLLINKSLRFSKYKLCDKPFNAACSEIYSESQDDMPLILI